MSFPLSEVYNQVVALDAVWGGWASEIREQFYAAPTVEAGLFLFEQLLRDRLRETPKTLNEQNIIEYAISAISQKRDTVSIQELSD